MLVLFGSETGNAQDVAELVAREATICGVDSCALPMDCVSVQEMASERLIVFVSSTTGQGEVPHGMKQCWRNMLRKGLPGTLLSNTNYAVFGLGDSGYVQFNVVAKKLDRRLEQLGGKRLIDKGLGDDQATSGYEASLDPWMDSLFAALPRVFPKAPGNRPATSGLEPCRFSVHTVTSPDPSAPIAAAESPTGSHLYAQACAAFAAFQQLSAIAAGMESVDTVSAPAPSTAPSRAQATPHPAPSLASPHWATVTESKRLTAPDHWQVVQHVEFDISGSGLTYSPGDLLATLPRVPESTGREFLERVGVAADATLTIGINATMLPSRLQVRMPKGCPLPEVTAPALAVACGVLDIAGAPPRRRLFRLLAAHATAPEERERLEYFGSSGGRDDLATYCSRERRPLLDVLKDFPSAAVPLESLLEAAPRLHPRQFSLSSSPLAHPGQAHITVAEVDYRTPFRRRVKGLCSSWLASLRPGDVAPVWVDKGALAMPPLHVPLVCVGPGTGVAPFRSFLQERSAAARAGHAVAPSVLVLGFRNEGKDFLYAEEWEQLIKAGVLREEHGLICAFSRDQPSKRYVQHCIKEHRALMWSMLHDRQASVFVSGSASKMPAAVADAFTQVIASGLGCSAAEAGKLQRRLEAAKRYCVEAWS